MCRDRAVCSTLAASSLLRLELISFSSNWMKNCNAERLTHFDVVGGCFVLWEGERGERRGEGVSLRENSSMKQERAREKGGRQNREI